MGISLPKKARIIEVGPRDGLQNEKNILPTEFKVDMINQLSETGLDYIEATSFVSPKWVPQMADNREIFGMIQQKEGVTYSALVPNSRGMKTALETGVKEIAIFTGASEGFVQKNINCSIVSLPITYYISSSLKSTNNVQEQSFERFSEVIESAQQNNIRVRGYVSCVAGCPYDGEVSPEAVNMVTNRLLEMGCYQVSLGDTIGVGTPESIETLMQGLEAPRELLAAHFHDTGGMAIQNILVALKHGISVFDSSVGGLGGCPYAKKAAGNLCSETLVYTLHSLGVKTGVDLESLKKVGDFVSEKLDRENLRVSGI